MIDQGNSMPPDVFWSSLYQTVVSFTGLILPILVIPPALIVAMIRSCLTAHCCQPKYKQAAGEIFLVFLVTLVYIGSIAGSIIPHLDQKIEEFSVDLDSVPVLWELANAAVRPAIYFLCNPAVYDGLKGICCSRTRRLYLLYMIIELDHLLLAMEAFLPKRTRWLSLLWLKGYLLFRK